MSRAAAAEKQTALEHLHELWLRLMVPVVVMVVGGGVAYVFRQQIIVFLKRPLGMQLYYTSPMGSFQFVMQACLLVGVVLALPALIYNALRFIEPVFSKGFDRRFVLLVLGSSLALAAAGVAFSYYCTLPMALRFFGSVGTGIRPLITANEYLSFMLGYLVTFAIVFQLPLLLLFINHITPLKPGSLTKWRKYVYVGAFAISLIMPSSPDPLSQVSLAIPIIALYELSILLLWAVNRKKFAALSRAAANALPDLADDIDAIFEEIQERFSIAREQAVMAMGAGALQPAMATDELPVSSAPPEPPESRTAPVAETQAEPGTSSKSVSPAHAANQRRGGVRKARGMAGQDIRPARRRAIDI